MNHVFDVRSIFYELMSALSPKFKTMTLETLSLF